jgi:hypothetical protein
MAIKSWISERLFKLSQELRLERQKYELIMEKLSAKTARFRFLWTALKDWEWITDWILMLNSIIYTDFGRIIS